MQAISQPDVFPSSNDSVQMPMFRKVTAVPRAVPRAVPTPTPRAVPAATPSATPGITPAASPVARSIPVTVPAGSPRPVPIAVPIAVPRAVQSAAVPVETEDDAPESIAEPVAELVAETPVPSVSGSEQPTVQCVEKLVLDTLSAGDKLVVKTHNSTYNFEMYEDLACKVIPSKSSARSGVALLVGGLSAACDEHTPNRVYVGGRLAYQFSDEENCVLTSVVESIFWVPARRDG